MAVLLNAAMMTATPVIGAHYVVDVIGGIVVAVLSVALAKYFVERATRRASTSMDRPVGTAIHSLP